jgi:peptide/nickel transport system ATP-binding protein
MTTAGASAGPILRVEDLTVAYRHGQGWLDAIRDVRLEIATGQTYGLVGESGSGKSTLALTIMRYLGEDGQVRAGRIEFAGRDLLALDPAAMRAVWGRQMNLVPQDPLSSLNPSLRLGEQVAETLRANQGLDRAAARARTGALLRMVRLADPERVADSFPHQVSGGMQQRVLIAMALSTEPRLLVLDEPTTGLDVTTEAAILDLLRDLMREHATSALYVTHNLGVVARICERVAVLYAGELVEDGTTLDLYRQPLHPYTQGLIDSIPRPGARKNQTRLHGLAGQIPPLSDRPAACVYAPRCPLAIELCFQKRPPLDAPVPGRSVRCHRWPEILAGQISARPLDGRQPAEAHVATANGSDPQNLLQIEDLRVDFPLRRSPVEFVQARPRRAVHAVNGVSLAIGGGQTLGLVGESGSGKSTLARAVIGLVEGSGGTIELRGVAMPRKLEARSRDLLRRLQMVSQNPQEALNPYLTVGESLSRPLITLLGRSPSAAKAEAARLLAAVRLPADYAGRLPSQLSGGEKQRVAIARAFAADPELLVADEPVSALDVSVQASILNLLNDLQVTQHTSILFISHDIAVVGYLADVVAVLYLGEMMELARADDIFQAPHHPYTEALLSAVPVPDPAVQQAQMRLEGEVPSAVALPSGCPFHTRCPRFLGEICVQQTPPWREAANGKKIFCHIPLDELAAEQASVAQTNAAPEVVRPSTLRQSTLRQSTL